MKKPVVVLPSQNMPMEAPFQEQYNYSNCFNSAAILENGGIPVMPPFLTLPDALQLMEQADGLLLTGGADVSPSLYGEETLECCGKTEPNRDRADLNLLQAALQLHRPILGICRGCQLINVYLGGTLYQDLPAQKPDALRHSVYAYPDYMTGQAHSIEILQNTPLHTLLGKKKIGVNSLHHQAIRTLAPRLKPMALAPDGIVEAFHLPDEMQWLWGCQWHPEMMDDNEPGREILREFADVCRHGISVNM